MVPSYCPPRRQFSDYLVGALPDRDAELLDAHLAKCENCRKIMQELDTVQDELVRTLRNLPGRDELEKEAGRFAALAALQVLESRALQSAAKAELPPPPELDWPAGKELREYLLHERIGGGAMGAVYRATHTKLRRPVAIKILTRNSRSDGPSPRRFLAEFEAAGRVEHPHVVRSTDAGEIDGIHFLVMELVDGVDLSHLSNLCGPLPWADACELIRQAALGLQCAHEQGLVHRDIKPSNLMLNSHGQVKVLDLGLARCVEGDSSKTCDTIHGGLAPTARFSDTQASYAADLVGTVEYMAPEQAIDIRAVDARSDIYSLGCTFFRLLTGSPPFIAKSDRELLRAHQLAPVPSLCAQRPGIPAAVEAVCQRMMAKVPGDRFATMRDVAEQCARLLRENLIRPASDTEVRHLGDLHDLLLSLRRQRDSRLNRHVAHAGNRKNRLAAASTIIAICLAAAWVARSYFGDPTKMARPVAGSLMFSAPDTDSTRNANSSERSAQIAPFLRLAASADGAYAAALLSSDQLAVWDCARGKVIRQFTVPEGSAEILFVGERGPWVVTAGNDQILRAWDLLSGECREAPPTIAPKSSVSLQLRIADGSLVVTVRERSPAGAWTTCRCTRSNRRRIPIRFGRWRSIRVARHSRPEEKTAKSSAGPSTNRVAWPAGRHIKRQSPPLPIAAPDRYLPPRVPMDRSEPGPTAAITVTV